MAVSEKKLYFELKRSHWTLLRKKEYLSPKQDIALQSILYDHALFPISTGKLEGFNNKIKIAKRIAYNYREPQFFSP